MFSWKSPKKTVKNILFYFSILSLIGALAWLSVLYIWNNRPDLVVQYDKNMPNVYSNKIDRLMTRTHKGKFPEDTFYRLQQLQQALIGTTQLHKFYTVFTENQIKMVDYLMNAGRTDTARKLVNKWQMDYPYDFNAKFKYAEVLTSIDTDLALNYYQQLYTKHQDIFEVNQRYVSLLLKHGKFNQALEIAEYSKDQNRKQTHVKFHFYYADELHPKYSEKSKIYVPAIRTSNQNYQVKLKLEPQGLNKLRFDFDRLLIGSTITNLSFNIKTPSKDFLDIPYKPLRHLNDYNGVLTIDGNDPYVQVLLPEKLIGSNHELQIEANIGIEKNKPLVLDIITDHNDWQVNCSKNLEFQQSKNLSFNLSKQGKYYNSKPVIYEENCQRLKIGFPFIQNLSFSDLTIKATNFEWSEQHIIYLNGIEKHSEGFVVVGENPYLIINTNDTIAVKELEIQMKLGAKP